jgi:hypothetical protein
MMIRGHRDEREIALLSFTCLVAGIVGVIFDKPLGGATAVAVLSCRAPARNSLPASR